MTPVESKEKYRAGKWELFRGRPNGPERGSSKKINKSRDRRKGEKEKIKGKKSRERKRKRKKKKEQGSAVATKGGTGS